jgi:hypothetical protein
MISVLFFELKRIAREAIFITTPNWTISRCAWPFHLREYTPMELWQLLSPLGQVRLFKGNGPGTIIHPVNHVDAYFSSIACVFVRSPQWSLELRAR